MKTRELYEQKYEAQMHEWDAKLDLMKAQGEKLNAAAKLEVKPHLDAVHAKLEIAKARFHEIAEATDEKWEQVTKRIDEAWSDFKAATAGAYDALSHHKTD